MLGKLLKYEIKFSFRYIFPAYIAAAIVSLILVFGSVTGSRSIEMLGLFLVSVVIMALILMTVVTVIKNFSETLFGDQGYLTFTLPVKSGSILFSKVFISFFWILVSCSVACLMGYVAIKCASTFYGGSFQVVTSILEGSALEGVIPSKRLIIEFLAFLGLMALLEIFVLVSFVYFSITISNTRLFASHPFVFGACAFVAIYSVVSSIASKLMYSVPLVVGISSDAKNIIIMKKSMELGNDIASVGITGLIFKVVVSCVLIFLTNWIMTHKINLK